jgi:hypothetical protein
VQAKTANGSSGDGNSSIDGIRGGVSAETEAAATATTAAAATVETAETVAATAAIIRRLPL